MAQAAAHALLLGGGQSVEQHLAARADDPVALQCHLPLGHGQAGGLQRLGLGQAGVEIAVELHEEGRGRHVIDVPEGADGAARARLQCQAREAQFAVLVAQSRAAGAQGDQVKGLTAASLTQL